MTCMASLTFTARCRPCSSDSAEETMLVRPSKWTNGYKTEEGWNIFEMYVYIRRRTYQLQEGGGGTAIDNADKNTHGQS